MRSVRIVQRRPISRFPTRVRSSMRPARRRPRQQDLVLFDRKGGAEPLGLPPGSYNFPRVSPDGKRIAFETNDGKEAAVSIYELSGASAPRRLTFGGNNRYPIWSADGQRVTFQSDREGDPAVCWQPADGGNRGAPHDTRTGHVACARVVVSRRRGAAVQRDEGLRLVALDVLAQGSESDPVRRREGFVASDQRDVLTRRPLGGVPDGRSGSD